MKRDFALDNQGKVERTRLRQGWVLPSLIVLLLFACNGPAAFLAQDGTATPAQASATSVPASTELPAPTGLPATVTPSGPPSRDATSTARPATVAVDTATPRPTESGGPQVANLGDTMIRSADAMEMVFVPAGVFLMGSLPDEPDADGHEFPAHEVQLDAFWLDRTEVTNDQFAAFVTETGYVTTAELLGNGRAWTGVDWVPDPDASWQHPTGAESDLGGLGAHPVVMISWEDADNYCQWAGARLPTEAEWEYAARGPESLRYPWGNEFDQTLLNYCDSNCAADVRDATGDDGYALTAPVGSYPGGASWVGALDMAGNVYERVADWYDENYYQQSPAENPTGPEEGERKISRGGSWHNDSVRERAAFRAHSLFDWSTGRGGFRCVAQSDAASE